MKFIKAIYDFIVGDMIILVGVIIAMLVLALINTVSVLAPLRAATGFLLVVVVIGVLTATLSSTGEGTSFLRGTAGFGFWNYPFSVQGDILMLPEAVWFFYASPPSNIALVPGIPGWGWKAQIVHSMRPGALAATVPLAATIAFGLLTGETRPAAHWMQKVSGSREALLPVEMTEWHRYTLEWQRNGASFWVDDTLVLHSPHSPTRPLGFVAWLDNQYALATPRGVLRFGTISSGPQWLEMDSVKIESL